MLLKTVMNAGADLKAEDSLLLLTCIFSTALALEDLLLSSALHRLDSFTLVCMPSLFTN
jgi:hypothetical protein